MIQTPAAVRKWWAIAHQTGLPSADIVKFNNSVQVAIWLEVLNHNPNPPSIPWTATSLATQYISGGVSNYNASWVSDFLGIPQSGNHGVQIMNLRSSSASSASYIQDQLVRNGAPEAASIMVWSLLISCGTMFAGRRRDKHAG